MGAVYEAVRDDGQFAQKVAIKVLRPGVGDPEQLLNERKILAQLKHPFIAQLIDGGQLDGLNFIVMERIDGQPLDVYAREFRLGLRDRLQLFIKVCEAVQCAHANLIVHRDLKPANILVTTEGNPKLLDFGVARPEHTMQTNLAMLTPRYASPEQLSGAMITVASDVYSLGVVLRELLEGFRIPKDLTTILAMALRPEPQRRYGSVSQFAEDIQRFLDGQMVIASPDTWSYRAAVFARRSPYSVLLGALVLVVVISGSVLVWRQGRIAQRRFEHVHGLVGSMLNEMQTEASHLVGSAHLRRLLTEKAIAYLARLEQDSSGDRVLAQEIANAYHEVADSQGHRRRQNLGLYQESLENHWKGIEIEKRLLASDPNNRQLISQMTRGYAHLAELYLARGESDKAVELGTLAVSMGDRATVRSGIDARFSLARILHVDGKLEDALRLLQDALAKARDLKDTRLELSALNWAIDQTIYLGLSDLTHEYNERLAALLGTMELKGEDLSRLYDSYRRRGIALSLADDPSEERHCEAVPLLRNAAAGQLDVSNQDPRSINRMILATTIYQFLSAAQAQCGLREAVDSIRQAHEIFNRGKRRENPTIDFHLAFAHFHLKQYKQAEEVIARVSNPFAQLLELKADLSLLRNQKEQARAALAEARGARKKELSLRTPEWYWNRFRLARNHALSLRAGDRTPGLREEGLRLLQVFPEKGVMKSIIKLRKELSS
jgi:serine/threonine protein kinase